MMVIDEYEQEQLRCLYDKEAKQAKIDKIDSQPNTAQPLMLVQHHVWS